MRHRPYYYLLVSSAFALTFALASSSTLAKSKWEMVSQEKGVTVSKRDIPELELPIIKGVGMISNSIYDILAVLDHTERNPEWMHSCKDARTLSIINNFERIIYTRIDSPWPVDDRDAVVRTKIIINDAKKSVLIKFWSIKSNLVKPTDDAVRMPMLKGFYRLDAISENRTRVTYQAQADPGGMIPNWLVEMNSKEIPLNTIVSLRKQVKATAGTYSAFLSKWDPEQNGEGFSIR